MTQTTTRNLPIWREPEETYSAVQSARREGKSIGLVPTMGALHEGHLSLVDQARSECDYVLATIFVNPTQFGPHEDLASYPRDLDRDARLLSERGIWAIFAPTSDVMYPAGHETYVDVGSVASPLEGAARPTHFRGVATVVLKLLLIAPADRAYFGQKDYQQTLVVQQLVRDLSVPIEIRICPIVREPDGLAMSSRNAYLSPDERAQATILWRALQLTERLHAAGESDVVRIKAQVLAFVRERSKVEIEYLAFLEEGAVRELETLDRPAVVAIAGRIGTTRLIDNHKIG